MESITGSRKQQSSGILTTKEKEKKIICTNLAFLIHQLAEGHNVTKTTENEIDKSLEEKAEKETSTFGEGEEEVAAMEMGKKKSAKIIKTECGEQISLEFHLEVL